MPHPQTRHLRALTRSNLDTTLRLLDAEHDRLKRKTALLAASRASAAEAQSAIEEGAEWARNQIGEAKAGAQSAHSVAAYFRQAGAALAFRYMATVQDMLGLALSLRAERDEARLDAASWEGRHDFLRDVTEARIDEARDAAVEDIRQANIATAEAQALAEKLQARLDEATTAKLRARLQRKTDETARLKRDLIEARGVNKLLARRVAEFERLHKYEEAECTPAS